jgi:predicted cupin superfamily sugar epimerase
VYRSEDTLAAEGLPARFGGRARQCATHIFYMLVGDQVSRFHRIKSDELWHFYAGTALEVSVLYEDGRCELLSLSPNEPFGVVPAGAWFGASLPGDGFALVGCTVAPGFDFADFEMADPRQLIARYPQHSARIHHLS